MRTDDEIYAEMARKDVDIPSPFLHGAGKDVVVEKYENSEKPSEEWLDCDFSDSQANDAVLASLDQGEQ